MFPSVIRRQILEFKLIITTMVEAEILVPGNRVSFGSDIFRGYIKEHPSAWLIVITVVIGFGVEFGVGGNARPFMLLNKIAIHVFVDGFLGDAHQGRESN
jgi:hypothetical protein